MKKMVSLLLTAGMLLSCASTSVMAEDAGVPVNSGTIGKTWNVSTSGSATVEQLNFSLSTENVLPSSAPYALKLAATEKVDSTVAVKIPVTLETDSVYRISFKSTQIFGNGKARNNMILTPKSTGWTSGCKQFSSNSGVTTVNLETINGKQWYEHTLNYKAVGKELYLTYKAAEATITDYFDDFEISKVNYDSNGFETGTTKLQMYNSDFDAVIEDSEAITSGTLGGKWNVTTDSGVTASQMNWQVSTENAWTGLYSLKLTAAEQIDKNTGIKFPVKLEKGATYRFNFKTTLTMQQSQARNQMKFSSVPRWESGCRTFSSAADNTVTLGKKGDLTWYEHTFDYAVKGENLYLSYNPTKGTWVQYFDDFNLSKVNEDGTLTPVEIYNNGFELNYEDGPKVQSGALGAGWRVSNTGLEANHSYYQLSTENVLPSGSAYSLKLNAPEVGAKTIALKFPVTLETGSVYRINFKSTQFFGNGKARNNTTLTSSANGWTKGCKSFSNSDGVTSVNLETINGKQWYEHTLDLTAIGADLYLAYNAQEATSTEYFDDFNISKVNEDGTITPIEIKDNNFELITEEIAPVTNLTEANGVLSWENPTSYFDYVNIYEKKLDNTYTKVAGNVTGTSYNYGDSLEAERTFSVRSVIVKGDKVEESDYATKVVDGKYAVVEAESFKTVTFAEDFSSTGEGATAVKTISKLESGNVMATMKIKNMTDAEVLPVKYVAALFNGGELVDVAVAEKDITTAGEAVSAVLNIADADAGEYTIKTFLWDGSQAPLKFVSEIAE